MEKKSFDLSVGLLRFHGARHRSVHKKQSTLNLSLLCPCLAHASDEDFGPSENNSSYLWRPEKIAANKNASCCEPLLAILAIYALGPVQLTLAVSRIWYNGRL